MSFKHEVFISYRHIPPTYANWVRNAFYKTINDHIVGETGNANAVYIDLNNLEGEDWKNQVFPALIQSKIIVTIWTPFYFDPDCVAIQEYTIANKRRLDTKVESLFPISLTDKEVFAKNPDNIEAYDCKPIFYEAKLCVKTKKFHSEMKTISSKILDKIKNMSSELDQNYFDKEHWNEFTAEELKNTHSQYVNLSSIRKSVTTALR